MLPTVAPINMMLPFPFSTDLRLSLLKLRLEPMAAGGPHAMTST